MKCKQFSEARKSRSSRNTEFGVAVADLIRKHSISQGTHYRWKSKLGGMHVSRRAQPIQIRSGHTVLQGRGVEPTGRQTTNYLSLN